MSDCVGLCDALPEDDRVTVRVGVPDDVRDRVDEAVRVWLRVAVPEGVADPVGVRCCETVAVVVGV